MSRLHSPVMDPRYLVTMAQVVRLAPGIDRVGTVKAWVERAATNELDQYRAVVRPAGVRRVYFYLPHLMAWLCREEPPPPGVWLLMPEEQRQELLSLLSDDREVA